MQRIVAQLALVVGGIATLIGCQNPNLGYVPWYRGIPANLMAKNSLEAEVWRQQRTGIVEGWPIPPAPVVRDPIGEPETISRPPAAPVDEEPAQEPSSE